jgi:nucleoside-diphosphate-sugar epimerase
MKKVLIAGTNGMIGSAILQLCLMDPELEKVISITRKPIGILHPKLSEVIHPDFTDFTPVSADFSGIDLCFFCVGVYTGQVSRELFRKITVDITFAFAAMLKKQSPDARFCFLSGQGADISETSKIMFALDKGIAENKLMHLGFSQLSIFRPGYIYPVQARKEPNLMYRILRWIYPILRYLYPNIGISSADLAKVMFTIGRMGSTQTIYENRDIRNIARSLA